MYVDPNRNKEAGNLKWILPYCKPDLPRVVGAIVLGSQPFPALRAIVPTMAATAVTMLATWFVADAANDGLLRVIAPSLVALLPGLALTVGAMELADSAIIAGTARLMYGIVQLVLLVFGVSLGMTIAGRVDPQEPSPQLGPWSFYAAIVVVGIGLYIYLSGPLGSLWWLTAAVGVASATAPSCSCVVPNSCMWRRAISAYHCGGAVKPKGM